MVIAAQGDTGPTQFLEGDKCTVYMRIFGYDISTKVQCEPFWAEDVG